MLNYQDETSGLWWAVVNKPGKTYLETSTTALFGYGLSIGYRYKIRDSSVIPVILKALDGIKSRIRQNKKKYLVVTGISSPTSIGDLNYYRDVPLCNDISYGVGPVILFLTESSLLFEKNDYL